MIIRCERCSTLYELDEALLAPDGSAVQCTRCQAVFTARPPRAPASVAPAPPPAAAPSPPVTPATPAVPAAPAPALHQPSAAPATATPWSPGAPPAATPGGPPAGESAAVPRAAEPRTPRPPRAGPAIYRPPSARAAPAQASSAPASGGGRGPVGAFEARARRTARWKRLLLPGAAALLLALVAGGTALWFRRSDPEAQRLSSEAAARLAQDDAGSLARAVQLYDQVLARSPRRTGVLVDRAVARLLLAAAHLEEAEPFQDQLAGRAEERERLLEEAPAGMEDALRLLVVETTRLEGEVALRRKAADGLISLAEVDLRTFEAAPGGEGAASRALALRAALASDREETVRLAALAREKGPSTMADLAEAWLDLRSEGARDRAMPRLLQLSTSQPDLLRARFLLARAQALAGKREEALATATALLAANPRHERAQRLKSQLTSPPAQAPPPAAAPAAPARRAAAQGPVHPPAQAPAVPQPAAASPSPQASAPTPQPAAVPARPVAAPPPASVPAQAGGPGPAVPAAPAAPGAPAAEKGASGPSGPAGEPARP